MYALWTWLTTNHGLANALAAIFSAVTALLALVVSLAALRLSAATTSWRHARSLR
jgi:hypothetical protein